MDRSLVYPAQNPLETDFLNLSKNVLLGEGQLMQALMGQTPIQVRGLQCLPDPGMNVTVSPGEIYSFQTVDPTAYSSLGTDSRQTVKQGILWTTVTLYCSSSGLTSGQAKNYLIQAAQADVDANATVLPFYNAANPNNPYSGPANNGLASYTQRQSQCVVTAKGGTAAASGSQTTPPPDTGNIGLWVVTVVYFQTQIVSGNIAIYQDNWLYPLKTYLLSQYVQYPLSALPFPHVGTATNCVTITAQVVTGSGGTVTVAAGPWLTLSEVTLANTLGRVRGLQVPAFVSPLLTANSTYYLRGQLQYGGVLATLQVYVQKGADTDAIPSGLVGTPNGASGGGFDSTPLDILLAKVVTGVNGSTPTVTPLANRAFFDFTIYTHTPTSLAITGQTFTVNLARAINPILTNIVSQASGGGTGGTGAIYLDGSTIYSTPAAVQALWCSTVSRYAVTTQYTNDANPTMFYTVVMKG